jgi:hypothetical protein
MRAPIRFASLLASGLAMAVVVGNSRDASATTIIKDPHPPEYKVEIEPHLNVQYLFRDTYGAFGFGPGVRFGIPIMSPGFIKSINDSVAISFGADLLYLRPHRKFCDRGVCTDFGGDGFWALYAPVALQWNFWITDKISVFGEPGLVFRTPFGDDCDRLYGCRRGSFGDKDGPVWWAFYGGVRFHFSDTIALTLRAGYPTGLSVGVSIF